jgi:hypothetical protein
LFGDGAGGLVGVLMNESPRDKVISAFLIFLLVG